LFRYLLVGDTVMPRGLYARLCHAFLVRTKFAHKVHLKYRKCITLRTQIHTQPFYGPLSSTTRWANTRRDITDTHLKRVVSWECGICTCNVYATLLTLENNYTIVVMNASAGPFN